MASKRDQLQAHQFLVERAVSALVTRETDPEQPPFRRPGYAALGGLGVAVIALAAVGVYGIVVPGGADSWRDGESVVVEKETGTRYVYVDERLHPVENYTSALLALDREAGTVSISRESLAGVARGPRIGIPDAPDSLPGPDRLLAGGWTLCSEPAPDLTGALVPRSVLAVGQEPPAGADLGGSAVLVTVRETGSTYLVHEGYRHGIAAPDLPAITAALRPGPALRVSPAVVEALPMGLPLAPIPVPGAGGPSTAVPGRDLRVGQLLITTTSRGEQHWLAEADRLRPISELQYDVQRAYAPTAQAYPGGRPQGLPLDLLDAGRARQATASPPRATDPPTERPAFAETAEDASTCLSFAPGAAVPRVAIGVPVPTTDPMTATPRRTEGGVVLADRVSVPAGAAAVVESMPSEDAPAGTVVVVTDDGVAHPLASPDLLGVLGYGGVAPVRVPAGLVARLPMASGLSHDAAMTRR
ncbi:type VII secretion protein EccB [Actinokineospora bangkokensis]|uniref:Type VII secretion protein EccB n=1 Tax=Actinokineospora bangkokensis TaxID=1193682 RepID=A0A1Q9LSV3_9PSEU|nr:type VII secretion protein EccB [Actinokineospora bangkokensis]OLR95122.1 type VII secretion protein EccB [Actinokineospora bangkokensis]